MNSDDIKELDDEEEMIDLEDFASLEDDEIDDLLKLTKEGENNEWGFRTKKSTITYLYS